MQIMRYHWQWKRFIIILYHINYFCPNPLLYQIRGLVDIFAIETDYFQKRDRVHDRNQRVVIS